MTLKKILFISMLALLPTPSWAQNTIEAPIVGLDAADWKQPMASSLLPEERNGLWLVQVESVDVDRNNPTRSYSIVQITHNYSGPTGLIGQRFTASGPFFTGSPGLPLMELGSNGVFVVTWSDTTQRLRDASGYSFDFPALEKAEKLGFGLPLAPYPEGVAYAQGVERVAKANRNEGIRLLEEYCKSASAPLCSWAITTLAESDVDTAPQFLLGLASAPNIPLMSQLTLDATLESLGKNGKIRWSDTPTRFQMWHRLVTSQADDTQAVSIVDRIVDLARTESSRRDEAKRAGSAYTPWVDGTRMFDWLRLAKANINWTPGARAFAVGRVAELSQKGLIDRGLAWSYLIEYVKLHPDFSQTSVLSLTPEQKEFNAFAAESALIGIEYLAPFSSMELTQLRSLQSKAKSPRFKFYFGFTK